jgi:hypothetical protein
MGLEDVNRIQMCFSIAGNLHQVCYFLSFVFKTIYRVRLCKGSWINGA